MSNIMPNIAELVSESPQNKTRGQAPVLKCLAPILRLWCYYQPAFFNVNFFDALLLVGDIKYCG